MLDADSAVTELGADTSKCVAAAGDTEILLVRPGDRRVDRVGRGGVCWPAVFRVALNVAVPLVSVLFAGRVAFASLLVKCTVPV